MIGDAYNTHDNLEVGSLVWTNGKPYLVGITPEGKAFLQSLSVGARFNAKMLELIQNRNDKCGDVSVTMEDQRKGANMESKTESKFWLVWRDGSATMHFRHTTEASANAEAERLARLNPGSTFYVVEAKRKAACVGVVVSDLDDTMPAGEEAKRCVKFDTCQSGLKNRKICTAIPPRPMVNHCFSEQVPF